MKVVSRIIAIILFIVFFGLAVKNTQETILYFFFGYEMHGPLVLLLLGFFAAGSILGVLAMTPMTFRNRRELARKRKIIAALEEEKEATNQAKAAIPVPDNIINNDQKPA